MAALAVGLIATVGACSQGANSLDRAATERAVLATLAERMTPVPDEVSCPANIDRGADEVVTCDAILPDGIGTVRVDVSQRDGGSSLDIDLVDAIIDRAKVATDLRRELVDAYGRTFTVSCGEAGPEVMEPGAEFDCEATDEGGSRTIRARVVNGAGTVTFDIGTGSTRSSASIPAGSEPA